MQVFPPLEVHSLFLASPVDVIRLRRMAHNAFSEMADYAGRSLELHMFAWEDAELEDNDARPIQSRISRPDDVKSLGLAAFFGERVGQELPEDFPKDMLDELPGLTKGATYQGKAYRLVHPWEEGAETKGGFPLTGSTFEALCAVAGQRRLDKVGAERTLPAFICFASPPEVLDEEDASAAPWGNDAVLNEINAKHKGRAADKLKSEAYLQRDQLRNFACYLKALIGDLRFIADDEEILDAYKEFLNKNSIVNVDLAGIDPFRGLKSYDVGDTRAYFGRDQEIDRVIRRVNTAFADDTLPNVFWVKGISGVGKSSFLRAGLIGGLVASPLREGNYAHHVFRPNQLLADDAATAERQDPLYIFLEGALKALSVAFPEAAPSKEKREQLLKTLSQLAADKRAQWVIETLDNAIAETDDSELALPNRLIIGIDQFEEIVDMIHDPGLQDRWSGFVDFLVAMPKASHFFIAATLRERRLEIMKGHERLSQLWEATCDHVQDLDFPSPTALETIIRRPFELIAKTALSEEVVRALLEEIRTYRQGLDRRRAGSMMPLVSLVLERLHLEVGEPLRKKKFGDGEDLDENEPGLDADLEDASGDFNPAAREEFDARPVEITLEDAKPIIKLDGVISELASRAMKEAEIDSAVGESDSTIDDLLRRLVRWSGMEAEGDTQFFLPAIDMPSSGDEAKLARALLNNRILMDVGEGKVKLVHEAVIRHWPEAQDFRERERPLYRNAHRMASYAEEWDELGRGDISQTKVEEFAETAFDLLGLWVVQFSRYFNKNPSREDETLRDFCLQIMKQVCEPRKVVERTPKKSHHLYIAVLYERLDIVDAMLSKDPEAADVPRADNRNAIFPLCFTNNLEILEKLTENGANIDQVESDGWKPIQVAAVGGSIDFIERLLEKGASLETERVHVLHWAARYDHPKLVKHLIEFHKVDPDLPDTSKWTPAMHAAGNNASEGLRALYGSADLDKHISWDSEKPDLFAPIHVAAANGKLDAVKALIELGVPIDSVDGAGGTALHYAAKNGHETTVSYLAALMAETDDADVDAPMIYAWSQDDIEKTKKGLANTEGASRDAFAKLNGWTALHVAVKHGHLLCVQALVRAGADPDKTTDTDTTPMDLAIQEEKTEIAAWLASHCDLKKRGADGRTPLQTALHRGDLALAVELAGRDPDRKHDYIHDNQMTDAYRVTGLHRAAAAADERMTKFYLLGATSPSATDAFGRTPLHIAALNGQPRQVKPLLRGETANLIIKDRDGLTPLEAAAAAGRPRVFKELFEASENLDLQNECPDALHHAARGGEVAIVETLLGAGYPADRLDEAGLTPLMTAVLQDNAAVVALLLGKDDVNAQRPLAGRDDVTACSLAIGVGALESLDLLLQKLGTSSIPVKKLAWQAVANLQFECAAVLLEMAGEGDFVDPKTGISLASLYLGKCDAYRQTLPAESIRSDRLEAILFPKPPEKKSEGGKTPPVERSKAKDREAKRAADRSDHQQIKTQSNSIGHASDIYPAYDREKVLWERVIGQELDEFVGQIDPVDGKHEIDPKTAQVFRRQLPWYDNVELIHITDAENFSTTNLAICYLTMGGNLFRLNGTSPPIHEVNAKAPIKLTEDNVADYLRFFCFFVRGEEGPFYALESVDDPLVPPADDTVLSVLGGTARSIGLSGKNEKGQFLADAVIFYSNAVFIADFAVHPTGMVEMLDDEPIAADLPIRIERPLA